MPAMVENWRSSGVATERRHGFGTGAGQRRVHLNGGVIHAGQRRHRQRAIAHDAEQQDGERDQRRHDRPFDEDAGNVHATTPASSTLPAGTGLTCAPGKRRNWPSVTTDLAGRDALRSTTSLPAVRLANRDEARFHGLIALSRRKPTDRAGPPARLRRNRPWRLAACRGSAPRSRTGRATEPWIRYRRSPLSGWCQVVVSTVLSITARVPRGLFAWIVARRDVHGKFAARRCSAGWRPGAAPEPEAHPDRASPGSPPPPHYRRWL